MSEHILSEQIVYVLCGLVLMLGLYAVVTKKNLIKIVIGLVIIEYAVNLFLVLVGYRSSGGWPRAPILTSRDVAEMGWFAENSVDPLPQAMILTSIVIGLGVLVLVVALCIRLYQKYGTLDITEIRRLRG